MPASRSFAGFGRIDFSHVIFVRGYAMCIIGLLLEQCSRSKPGYRAPLQSSTEISHTKEWVCRRYIISTIDHVERGGTTQTRRRAHSWSRSVCSESLAVCHTGRWTWDPGSGRTVLKSRKKQILFSQGEAADAVFYIQEGQVKLTRGVAAGQRSRRRDAGRWGLFGGILPRRTNSSSRNRDRRGRLPSCAHRQRGHDPSTL